MTPSEEQELKRFIQETVQTSIKASVKDAIQEELGEYKVPKEDHYIQHLWIQKLMEFSDGFKNEVMKTIVKAVVVAILALVVIGFGMKGGGS